MNSKIYSFDEIKSLLRPVFYDSGVRSATLFGSYAKGTATKKSDVDLYVDSDLKGLKFVGLIERVRNVLGKPVDMINSTHVEAGSAVAREIQATGIEIYA